MDLTDEGVIAEFQAGARLLKQERYRLLTENDQLKKEIEGLKNRLKEINNEG